MVSFFKILLIIIFIYYVLKIVFKFFLRVVFKKISATYTYNESERARYNRREGEVHIDKVPSYEKQIDKNTGEYIDYEEVRE